MGRSWTRRHLVLDHHGRRPLPSPEEVQATAEYLREVEAAYEDASRRYHEWQKVKWAQKSQYYQQQDWLEQQQQQQLQPAISLEPTESETSCSESCSIGTSTSDISHDEDGSPRVASSRKAHQQQAPHQHQPQRRAGPPNVCPQHRFRGTAEETRARYVAMDCEMVGVGPHGQHSVLARVTIVDWYGNLLMDEYVQTPRNAAVTDYRTFVSGITPEMLEASNGAISHESCQERVRHLLHGKVLVGHALKNDLKVLGISHPWYMTRDTAKYEPFMKTRGGYADATSASWTLSLSPSSADDGSDRDAYVHLWPRSLKELAQDKLQRDIQAPGQPHCPIEDAMAALDLYKLVSLSWENSMEYKVTKSKEIMKQQLLDHQQNYATNGPSASPTPQQQQQRNNNPWAASSPSPRLRKGNYNRRGRKQQQQQQQPYGSPQGHQQYNQQQQQAQWG